MDNPQVPNPSSRREITQSGESKGDYQMHVKPLHRKHFPKPDFPIKTQTLLLWANVISEGKKWPQYTDMYICVDTHWNRLVDKRHCLTQWKWAKKWVKNQQLFCHAYDCYLQNNLILAIHLLYDMMFYNIRFYIIRDKICATIYDACMIWCDIFLCNSVWYSLWL